MKNLLLEKSHEWTLADEGVSPEACSNQNLKPNPKRHKDDIPFVLTREIIMKKSVNAAEQ